MDYRKLPLISPGLIQLINGGAYMRGGLYPRGLISEGAYNDYNRNKETVSRRAIAVLIEIHLSCTGF